MSNEEQDAFTFNTLRNFEDVVSFMGTPWVMGKLDGETYELLRTYFVNLD